MIKKVDDFDGVSDAKTVEFSIDGVAYEIDLSEDSLEKMHKDFQKYIDVARKLTGQPSAKKSPKLARVRTPAAESTANNDAVRHWARQNGMKVSDRGRVPRDVQDAFDQAHQPSGVASMFSAAGAK